MSRSSPSDPCHCRAPSLSPSPQGQVREAQYKAQPMRALLVGFTVIAFFAAAMLMLTSLIHPAQANSPKADSTQTDGTQADSASSAPSAERQHELIRFVRQECGFCHGLHLTGGLGSPLTAPALADKPADALEATILYGRTGTAMPGWLPHLNESDATWIVAALLKGFPQ